MCQSEVKPETQPRKVIIVKLLRIIRSELVCSGLSSVRIGHQKRCLAHLSGHHCHFVRIDHRPCSSIGSMLRVPVEKPDEGDDEGVMCPAMTELMPPIFADWTRGIDQPIVPVENRKSRIHALILSLRISSFDHVSSCLLFRKIVWKMWSFFGRSYGMSISNNQINSPNHKPCRADTGKQSSRSTFPIRR